MSDTLHSEQDTASLSEAASALYASDRYLQITGGTWHIEDSPFKAKYIDQLVTRNKLSFASVCEVGCGAGAILAELQRKWPATVDFVGFEVSPQAHALSQQFVKPNLQYRLGDAFASNLQHDVVLVMDVIEHVEDCFGFLRKTRDLGRYKIYHIPLEINCSTALRDIFGRGYQAGHIHHYSYSSALEALRYTGHTIVDVLLTPVGLERGKHFRTRLANVVRQILPKSTATRLIGGYSLMALTT